MFYLDTSVLAAYYCPERLSPAVAKALDHITKPTISRLVECEMISALSMKVRAGDLDRRDAQVIRQQFQRHLDDGYYRLVEIGPRQYDLAMDWLERFTTPLRTLDALHLAAAWSHDLELFTSDKSLAASAKALRIVHKLITG